jgi:hypothetical protein
MNIRYFNTMLVMPLGLLWFAYALLGWHLAAHHIIWLVGAFVAVVVLALVSKSILWLEALVRFGSQTLVVVLILSSSIALIATWSLLISLFLLPLITTILANVEMRFAGFSELYTFLIITSLAVLGLGIGEMIDLVVFPSSRY